MARMWRGCVGGEASGAESRVIFWQYVCSVTITVTITVTIAVTVTSPCYLSLTRLGGVQSIRVVGGRVSQANMTPYDKLYW